MGSKDPEFKSRSAVELIPGGVDSARHPSEVGKNEYQLDGILYWSGDPSRIVPNSPGDCFGITDTLYTVWSQWMDGPPSCWGPPCKLPCSNEILGSPHWLPLQVHFLARNTSGFLWVPRRTSTNYLPLMASKACVRPVRSQHPGCPSPRAVTHSRTTLPALQLHF